MMIATIAAPTALFAFAVLIVAAEVLLILDARRMRRCFVQAAGAERIRGKFAEARNELVRLAMRGDIDARSASFRIFYYLQTAVMRRQDQHEILWKAFVFGAQQAGRIQDRGRLLDEARSWTPQFLRIVERTWEAADELIIEHSTALRLIYRFTVRLGVRRFSLMRALHDGTRDRVRREAARRRTEMAELQWSRDLRMAPEACSA